MSRNKLRTDKTCLNCNYVVENRFCPNCGQENIDSRKSFYHLFVHFFEDLTHYENAFWKTIKSLLFKPAALTKEYLSGKRMSYLAPVRLYIFISFITFFVFSILPKSADKDDKEPENKKQNVYVDPAGLVKITVAKKIDSIKKTAENKDFKSAENTDVAQKKSDSLSYYKGKEFADDFITMDRYYKNVAELDSIQKYGKPSEKLGAFNFWMNRKIQEVKDKYKGEELKDKLLENFGRNFPKALFLYMPIFAFLLWLFHNKRRWYYFDHGIFTLHYFSFLLLTSLLLKLSTFGLGFFGDGKVVEFLIDTVIFVAVCFMLYYFFPAHHRFYDKKRWQTIFMGSFLFVLNFIFMSLFLTLFIIYSLLTIH